MGYFSVDELSILNDIKANTTIVGVNYYRWHNLAVANDVYIFVDKIEFEFNNRLPILLEINETDDGITLKTNYNIALEINEVETTFNNQIKITQKNEINNAFWNIAKNNPIKSIDAQQFEQFYANEELIFNFGDQKIEIKFNHEKGLMVDFYEED